MNPTFKNKPNKQVFIDQEEHWISRSVAVGVVILAISKGNLFVLGVKRSENMPDGKGLWVVPSGYIDYDESGWDAMRRETWEESGFNINKYKNHIVFDNNKENWYTHTDPSENRQNIILWYSLIYNFGYKSLPSEVTFFKNKETDKVKWIPVDDLLTHYDWAFNHDTRIEQAIFKFKKHITL